MHHIYGIYNVAKNTKGPFYLHRSTEVWEWISDYTHVKNAVQLLTRHSLQRQFEFWRAWMSHYIPLFYMGVTTVKPIV